MQWCHRGWWWFQRQGNVCCLGGITSYGNVSCHLILSTVQYSILHPSESNTGSFGEIPLTAPSLWNYAYPTPLGHRCSASLSIVI